MAGRTMLRDVSLPPSQIMMMMMMIWAQQLLGYSAPIPPGQAGGQRRPPVRHVLMMLQFSISAAFNTGIAKRSR